jgi:putative heme transporter
MALRMVLRWGLLFGALGWTASQLRPLLRSVGPAAGVLAELSWGWVVAAALLGLAAVALYAELHRRLLAVGGARPPAAAVQTVTFSQNAIGNTVPVVGGAGALAYAVGGLRRRGVDTALATWTVLLAGVLSTLCLVVLGACALTAAGDLPLAGAVPVVAGVAAAAAAAWLLATHPSVLRGAMTRLLALRRRLSRSSAAGHPAGAAEVRCIAEGAAARLSLLRPSPGQWLQVLAVSALTWLVDFAGLAAAAAAVPGSVPWPALVEGFLVVQASIALQVLPGGAGLAELGLLGALLGSGTAAGPAAVVVLVYRATSWFVPSALGWLTYGAQLQRPGGRPQPSAAPAAEPRLARVPVAACQAEDAPAALPFAA